ncbi:MAG: 4Fe-4S binding protein [Eubacteriales bacterium]|nr:4Fe-4S binding protein [Eubacteriales bacterium]
MGEQTYFHSVRLNKDKCTGCTNCIKHCPTEAIRVRNGKARIINERCIDCGECVRVCPHHAKEVVTDSLAALSAYKYNIALPAPSLYGQFKNVKNIGYILAAIKELGFDDVFETSVGADLVSLYIRRELRKGNKNGPLISSACPAIVRLIQVRFPELTDNIIPLRPPFEAAAMMARERWRRSHACAPEEIGVFFISPCAAKMTSVNAPIGNARSHLSGVISMMDVYGKLAAILSHQEKLTPLPVRSFAKGVGWARSGGECASVTDKDYLAVDGVFNVIRALEEIENGHLPELRFFEGQACVGGCVGGPITFENPYVARMRIDRFVERMTESGEDDHKSEPHLDDDSEMYFTEKVKPNPIMKLDEDIGEAIKKIARIEELCADLPGLDCGSCGAPSCRCLAEDIVRGYREEVDCIFKLKEKVRDLAEEMISQADREDKVRDLAEEMMSLADRMDVNKEETK